MWRHVQNIWADRRERRRQFPPPPRGTAGKDGFYGSKFKINSQVSFSATWPAHAKPTSFVAVSLSVADLAENRLGKDFRLAKLDKRGKINNKKSEFGVCGGALLPHLPPSGGFESGSTFTVKTKQQLQPH